MILSVNWLISAETDWRSSRKVFRTALVPFEQAGKVVPALIVEPEAGAFPNGTTAREEFLAELRPLIEASPLTSRIEHVVFKREFPVDIRHNAKIFREKLQVWLAENPNGE